MIPDIYRSIIEIYVKYQTVYGPPEISLGWDNS